MSRRASHPYSSQPPADLPVPLRRDAWLRLSRAGVVREPPRPGVVSAGAAATEVGR